MKLFFFALTLFIAQNIFAQDTTRSATAQQTASVIVHKDARIDALIKKQESINTTTKKSSARTARGYRILIVNTNKREEAIAAKTKVYTLFPELKAYLSYQSPYFKLKAGNFKTRDEAERYRKNMSSIFPKGVFIINDIVEVKPEKEED
jgi:hypothetical protein